MTKYRQITNEEFESFAKAYQNCTKETAESVKKVIKAEYQNGESASNILLMLNNEYDDCNYTPSIVTVVVFDGNMEEIVPKKGKAATARKNLIKAVEPYFDTLWDYDTLREPMEDVTIRLDDSVPDLYVKEE